MLNKEICEKCTTEYGKRYFPNLIDIHIRDFNKEWNNGRNYCPYRVGLVMALNVKLDEPPDACPYCLEQIIANAK